MKQYSIYNGKILVNEGKSKSTYYYRTTIDGRRKKINLGHNESVAIQKLREIEQSGNIQPKTLSFVWDQYSTSTLLFKAKKTQRGYTQSWDQLSKIFGDININDIRRAHVIEYLSVRRKHLRDKANELMKDHSGVAANREIALLSILCNFAIDTLEYDIVNPCRNLRKAKAQEKGRSKYLENWEYDQIYNAGSPIFQNVLDLLYLTGQRIADVLKIDVQKDIQRNVDITHHRLPNGQLAIDVIGNHKADMLKVLTNKTQRKIDIIIEGELKEVLDRIMSQRKKSKVNSLYLLADKQGQPISYWTIYNEFRRIRKTLGFKAYEIQLRDIRRKNATEDSLENSQARLGHASSAMTENYRNNVMNIIARPIGKLK